MHYAFDKWMEREFPGNPWCRYADDGIVHCKTLKQAEYIKDRLTERLRECKLEIHPNKTKIVYCKDSNRKESYENIEFTFLSYDFKPRKAKGKMGKEFTSYLPAISNKAKFHIYSEIHGWRLLHRTGKTIMEIARSLNPVIRGWLNYYGLYGKRELARTLENINKHLVSWIRRKYKKYKHKPVQARNLLKKISMHNGDLFHTGKLVFYLRLDNKSCMT